MGATNLSHSLKSRYARVAGEVLELERQVVEAERIYAVLPELRAQIAKKKDSLLHIAAVLGEANPKWNPKNTAAIRPWIHRGPIPFGECSRRALELLRDQGRWMTVQEVVERLFREYGIEYEPRAYQRYASTVGNTFRSRDGKGLERLPGRPAKWRVARVSKAKVEQIESVSNTDGYSE